MAVIIRRNKPITIKRRLRPSTEDIHGSDRDGQGWVHIPGFPPDRTKRAYHALNIDGTIYAFLWEPRGRLGEEWRSGRHAYSPTTMKSHDYMGECTIVYRSSSTPPDNVELTRSKWRRY